MTIEQQLQAEIDQLTMQADRLRTVLQSYLAARLPTPTRTLSITPTEGLPRMTKVGKPRKWIAIYNMKVGDEVFITESSHVLGAVVRHIRQRYGTKYTVKAVRNPLGTIVRRLA